MSVRDENYSSLNVVYIIIQVFLGKSFIFEVDSVQIVVEKFALGWSIWASWYRVCRIDSLVAVYQNTSHRFSGLRRVTPDRHGELPELDSWNRSRVTIACHIKWRQYVERQKKRENKIGSALNFQEAQFSHSATDYVDPSNDLSQSCMRQSSSGADPGKSLRPIRQRMPYSHAHNTRL